ncbi:MAG: hypothetical protein HQM02_06745 [Magnetococcales bacterium]|nr:hypothetical protein [Magnetococcales bacterium]
MEAILGNRLLMLLWKILCRRSLKYFTFLFIDCLKGLDFCLRVRPEAVGLDPEKVYCSSPSGNEYLYFLLQDIGITCNDRIMDIGCGKGSAMRTMLSFPFARIGGIEISGSIGETAKRNFERLKADRVEVYIGDAVRFEGYGGYNMYYLYNPFSMDTLEQVLERIRNSTSEDQEKIIIYNNPVFGEKVIEAGFGKLKEYPDEWGNGIWVCSNRPARLSRLGQRRSASEG